jgi:hypothetical protein
LVDNFLDLLVARLLNLLNFLLGHLFVLLSHLFDELLSHSGFKFREYGLFYLFAEETFDGWINKRVDQVDIDWLFTDAQAK